MFITNAWSINMHGSPFGGHTWAYMNHVFCSRSFSLKLGQNDMFFSKKVMSDHTWS